MQITGLPSFFFPFIVTMYWIFMVANSFSNYLRVYHLSRAILYAENLTVDTDKEKRQALDKVLCNINIFMLLLFSC